ncbi:hypothetical protein AAG594_03020 [Citromicrobium bathyomarinum]
MLLGAISLLLAMHSTTAAQPPAQPAGESEERAAPQLHAPFTEEERAIIRKAVSRELRDPSSAQFRWNERKKNAVYCGFVNGRNAYGGYVGFTLFYLIYSESRLEAYQVKLVDPQGTALDNYVPLTLCEKAGYNLDPTLGEDDELSD